MIDKTAALKFPGPVEFIYHENCILAISVSTANWLVLKDDFEVNLVKRLTAGETIARITTSLIARANLHAFQKLLAQILARQFALPNHTPQLRIEDSTKSLYVYLTNKCNLSCRHCYVFSGKAFHKELSIDEWKRIISEFYHLGGQSITLSGGEVLLKRGWKSLIKFLKQLGLKVTLLSNGTLWKDSDFNFAKEWIDEIQISIDGPNEKINSKIRGKGHFKKAQEAAISLSLRGVRTSIAITPTLDTIRLTVGEIDTFVEETRLKSNNAILFRVGQKLLPGRSITSPMNEDAIFFKKITKEIANKIHPNYEIRNFNLAHKPNFGYKNCGLGGITINPEGNIFPCNRYFELETCGNLRQQNFADIFYSVAVLQEITSVDNAFPCKSCNLRYICGGGCRIDDFNFHEIRRSVGQADLINQTCDESFRTNLLNKMISTTQTNYKF
ncbi:MAG: radical SAM protein [Nitrospiraceae bacterium]|nr:radical SAM protein [Nitrospiraceae bacterium]